MEDQRRRAERILCLRFSVAASCSLVLVTCLGWELCRFGGGKGIWRFACTSAVSISSVSRSNCYQHYISADYFC